EIPSASSASASSAAASQETGILEKKNSPLVASAKPVERRENKPGALAQAVQATLQAAALEPRPDLAPRPYSSVDKMNDGAAAKGPATHLPPISQNRLPYAKSVSAGLGLVLLTVCLEVLANIAMIASSLVIRGGLEDDLRSLPSRLDTARLLLWSGGI